MLIAMVCGTKFLSKHAEVRPRLRMKNMIQTTTLATHCVHHSDLKDMFKHEQLMDVSEKVNRS